jgi:hypothetical protein
MSGGGPLIQSEVWVSKDFLLDPFNRIARRWRPVSLNQFFDLLLKCSVYVRMVAIT